MHAPEPAAAIAYNDRNAGTPDPPDPRTDIERIVVIDGDAYHVHDTISRNEACRLMLNWGYSPEEAAEATKVIDG